MDYITTRRFRDTAICGSVNIPACTECIARDGVIYWDEAPICYTTSENAHQFFARNDDRNGMERGKLIRAIHRRLAKRDAAYRARWDTVWADPVCCRLRRPEHADFWLWSHEFFNADIDTLKHIAALVGAKTKKEERV